MASLCPKCRQTIEEDQICCANLELQWKCQECHKRTRGFALPFGQCPLCGGALIQIEGNLRNKKLKAIQEAFQIEINACCFYRKLADAVDDPERSDFFDSLSKMEKEHAEEIAKKYHIHPDETNIWQSNPKPPPAFLFDDLCFFADTGDLRRLYQCAIALEKKTLQYFLEKAKDQPKGLERDLFLELAAEEREHITLLEMERDR